MVCVNDDYLRFIYGGNLGVLSYNMWYVMVGKSNFSIVIGFIWS